MGISQTIIKEKYNNYELNNIIGEIEKIKNDIKLLKFQLNIIRNNSNKLSRRIKNDINSR